MFWIPISLNVCFGCSKEPSHRDGSFEYPQLMFWLINMKIIFWYTLLTKGLCDIFYMGQLRNFRVLILIELWNDLFFTSTLVWITLAKVVIGLSLTQRPLGISILWVTTVKILKDKMSLFITSSFSAEPATYITADQFWLRAGFWIIKRKNKLIV